MFPTYVRNLKVHSKINKINRKKIIEYGVPIKSGTPDSILASLLRQIYHETGINLTKFDILVSRYVDKFTTNTGSRVLSSERGNVKKELLQEAISWNVFIKGLVLLNPIKVKLTLEVTHRNGVITKHEKPFELSYEDLENDTSNLPEEKE